MFTISVLNHHISFLLFVQQTISSRCITTPGASFVEHAGSRTLRRWRATDCLMPDLAVMFAFSLQPPQCYFSKGSGLQCTCKQLQCVCFSIKSTRVSAEHWKNRTEGNLNIYTKALTWSVPPVCSSLFAATNTTSSLFFVSGMFVYLKVLLLLSSDNRKVSALIPGCSSVLESVPWHKYWTSICWSEYECVWMCVWNMLYKVLL